jgi:GSH-dependent disulfide-bond oxidoreductase
MTYHFLWSVSQIDLEFKVLNKVYFVTIQLVLSQRYGILIIRQEIKMSDPFFTKKYPVKNPAIIQLFSLATPNGRKVSIALEEMGIEYEAHLIDIMSNEQFSDEYKFLNPNSKIPAIWDPNGPDGKGIAIMESGAILLYLAEKSNQFIPKDATARIECLQWLFFQMGSIGPMFGQFGHFYKYAVETCDHPYPKERYTKEVRRLLGVLEERLSDQSYIIGNDYTIADMAIFPWVGCLDWGYDAKIHLKLDEFPNVNQWHDRCANRPAAQKGSLVCSKN